ncbi:MAG: N-acetylgalactosamine-6-sulfatase [Bacteroidetes bacterium]|nr:MAG: N-acetylgalactosamine-6-sulfatase [Bacteroidota bacterium]
MKKLCLVLLISLSFFSCNETEEQEKPPNIIYFLADDLGYGEVGVYGQEKILTPNIDALAKNGMMFTQHYSGAPVCAPARYMFLTGKHSGHAFIRGNDEWDERGDVWDYAAASKDPGLEGQRPIPNNTITIGHQLQKVGYKTSLFGKWGLGAPESEGIPTLQGFDYFYGYNCQRQAHNLYPPHLWENTEKDILDNELVAPRTKLDSLADPYDEASYAKYNQKDYAPERIHEKALNFITENKDNPFFLYYASPLPHLPLQAPKEYVDKYRALLGDEEPYIGDKGYFPNRYPRATYAAMISYLDNQLGELIAKLKELDLYQNTIIIVSSDNGPTYTGGVDFDYFESSKPFANGYGRTKGYVYEGGVRVPLIASWPNKIKPGSKSEHISAFYDLMPTICDIAGIESPKDIDGLSFKSTLLGEEQQAHDFLYWEFPSYKGQQAVRLGKWKGVRKNIFDGNLEIELYDLDNDALEQNNLATLHPDIVTQIAGIMVQEHEPSENERFKFKQLGDE